MTLPLLKVAVVGHTNTGKTSLMRTLMRDATFGEVSDRPAVTRHVEAARLHVSGQPVVELFDTPGLEDSISLLEALEKQRGDRRVDRVDVVRTFLESEDAHHRFAQESKALKQVLASDVALYVIDARDRVLGKHRDELEILGWCASPVVPVLNFTASSGANTAVWREHLSRVNMHAVSEFDTVVYDDRDEQRLYEKIRSLLDSHRSTLDALIADRLHQRELMIRSSAAIVAELLVDAAAFRMRVPDHESRDEANRALDAMKQNVRDREQRAVTQLLELHRFRAEDVRSHDLPIEDGAWGVDLFSPDAMKQFGVRTGGGAAAGAVVGLTLDAMLGGLSLGAGAAAGAAVGGLLGAAQTHGRHIIDRMRGLNELRCDDATIALLAARQIALINALLQRGHASTSATEIHSTPASRPTRNDSMSRSARGCIQRARLHPRWSRIASTGSVLPPVQDDDRDDIIRRLSDALATLITPAHDRS